MIAQARYRPVGGSVAVFLIDQPQGLVPQAQEALLKPLEDPPQHVVWIFPTTDPGKLKPAIVSRCAAGHFSIRTAPTKALAKRLRVIADKEGYKRIPTSALVQIVEACDNHARDSVGVLEKLFNSIEDIKEQNRRRGREAGKLKLATILPKVIGEVRAGKPTEAARVVLHGIIGDNLTKAVSAVSSGDFRAEVLLKNLMFHWQQALLCGVNPKLIAPWFSYSMRNNTDFGRTMDVIERDSMPLLVRGAEYLSKQYERAKAYTLDEKWLLITTVTTLHQICVPLHPVEDDE